MGRGLRDSPKTYLKLIYTKHYDNNLKWKRCKGLSILIIIKKFKSLGQKDLPTLRGPGYSFGFKPMDGLGYFQAAWK